MPATNSPAATIALLNMKGGVGKTTLAVNLAWYLCRYQHKRVLLVDLDPQFNASQYTMSFNEWDDHRKNKGTVADVLIEPQAQSLTTRRPPRRRHGQPQYTFARESTAKGGTLHLLPSELTLSRAVKNPDRVVFKLEKYLESVRTQYDFIFIDCAPTDSILTDTALMATDFVLVPVKPDRFSILGYAQIQEQIASFKNAYPDPHEVQDLGVVFTQVDGSSPIENTCMKEVTRKASFVFETRVSDSRSYLRAVQEQTPVFDTRYAHWVTKATMRALVGEVMQRIGELNSDSEDET